MQAKAVHSHSSALSDIAVITVNYRTPELTHACAEAVGQQRSDFSRLRTIVVDGGSGDGSAEKIAASIAGFEDTELLALPVNGGFAYANNCAMQHLSATGHRPDAIALINPDARPRDGALRIMAALLEQQPKVGAVGGLLEHEDGRTQGCAFTFPSMASEFCRGAATGIFNRLLRVPPTALSRNTA